MQAGSDLSGGLGVRFGRPVFELFVLLEELYGQGGADGEQGKEIGAAFELT